MDTDSITVLIGDANVLHAEQVGYTLLSCCHVHGVQCDHVLAQLTNGQSNIDSASDGQVGYGSTDHTEQSGVYKLIALLHQLKSLVIQQWSLGQLVSLLDVKALS